MRHIFWTTWYTLIEKLLHKTFSLVFSHDQQTEVHVGAWDVDGDQGLNELSDWRSLGTIQYHFFLHLCLSLSRHWRPLLIWLSSAFQSVPCLDWVSFHVFDAFSYPQIVFTGISYSWKVSRKASCTACKRFVSSNFQTWKTLWSVVSREGQYRMWQYKLMGVEREDSNHLTVITWISPRSNQQNHF